MKFQFRNKNSDFKIYIFDLKFYISILKTALQNSISKLFEFQIGYLNLKIFISIFLKII